MQQGNASLATPAAISTALFHLFSMCTNDPEGTKVPGQTTDY
jgi:hypothetical protein